MYFRISKNEFGNTKVTEFNDDHSATGGQIVSSDGDELSAIRLTLQRFGDFHARQILLTRNDDNSILVSINTDPSIK